ncbi:hypothetical protein BLA60_08330 [Actinophytocola xinjiangensis]|uniref:Uncharacterized protein n=1 Tax=Actinophytocola xinjiangensis TaxID=485602 RepID=A0A7Z0WPJ9_9PSEU|nr:hypothetical protein [Actinophytocola xinjiangensis]OLF12027.1 hypothetical protein BLA60_08330 [Actinophytocola xinjiangensis]
MTTATTSRPRLTVGLTVLLVLVTLANLVGLALIVMTWVDEVSHGADLGDGELNAVLAALVLTAGALAGIAGAWLRHKWGPRLYLAAQLIGFVVLLANEAVGPLNLVPLVLAGVLCWIAESAW